LNTENNLFFNFKHSFTAHIVSLFTLLFESATSLTLHPAVAPLVAV